MIALYLLEPWRLLLLVIPALLLALILLSGKKRAESAVSFSTLGMLEGLVEKPRRWKSATPAALVVVALLFGVFGFARPATNGTDAGSKAVVVLVIDVSLSMSAVDVEPSRIEVAKDAALRFVAKAPSNPLIGVVAFDSNVTTPDGQVVPVPPDEQALSNIADIARGKSFTAATAKDLQAIYDSLSEAVVRKTNVHEHGDILTMLSLLAMFSASVLSLRWFRRII